jgi:hypothetical protein
MHHKNRSVAANQLILGKFWTLISKLWQVGSVFFGAIQDALLELLKSNYAVLHEESLACSADQQKWAYSSMVAIGLQIPKGCQRNPRFACLSFCLSSCLSIHPTFHLELCLSIWNFCLCLLVLAHVI